MKKKPTYLVLRNRAYGLKWRKVHREEERERARKCREDQIRLRKRDANLGKK